MEVLKNSKNGISGLELSEKEEVRPPTFLKNQTTEVANAIP